MDDRILIPKNKWLRFYLGALQCKGEPKEASYEFQKASELDRQFKNLQP